MKILVVCQYYYPEPVRINDVCEELVRMGNEVTVITDIPNYPMGEVYKGYEEKNRRNEKINGVNIKRCFTIPRKKGTFMRILNYYSFAISSTIFCSHLKEDYDVVLVNQLSPVMMAYGAIKYKRKHNKKLLLYCLDIWPESLKVGGIKEKSIIFKLFHWISKRIYKSCDKILITSKSFKEYLMREFGIKEEMIDYLPQYAESFFKKDDCKKNKDKNLDLMFAGNLGITQSLDTIIDAAVILKERKNIFFHFVGDGIESKRLIDKVEKLNLKNVIFHGRKKVEEMPKYYSLADAMLVTLEGNNAVSSTIPGKVQTYMAAGKPIIGAIDGETKIVIEESKCGFCGKADDAIEFAKNIIRFDEYKNKEQLGNNSYKYYEKNYKKEKYIKKLIEELNNCKGDFLNE